LPAIEATRQVAALQPVIQTRALRKSYGSFEAVRGVDLEVAPGEVFALLGPNGAGKTTVVEIMEGYRKRSAGKVRVLGEDPERASRRFRERIGIMLQTCRSDPEFKVREAIALQAGYYPDPFSVGQILDLVGLAELKNRRVGHLSGGEQRRLDVGLALVGNPELLFLDEPTTGFDPAARREFWGLIRELSRMGMTVFLTTHYMEEAEALANRVAVLVRGRMAAQGRPGGLGGPEANEATISFHLPPVIGPAALPESLRTAAKSQRTSQLEEETVVLCTEDTLGTLRALLAWAGERDLDLPGLEVHRPGLEEVYLRIVGEESDVSRCLGQNLEEE
jgi:ABC-2 type transport system ATP-binding protein